MPQADQYDSPKAWLVPGPIKKKKRKEKKKEY
jgi:hypothetical protein